MGGDPFVAGARIRSGQHALDLLQRHAQVTQAADDLGRWDLAGGVAPVTGVLVHLGWFQEPYLVVVAQGPDGHVGGT